MTLDPDQARPTHQQPAATRPSGLSPAQLTWAAQHDWFVAPLPNGAVLVDEHTYDPTTRTSYHVPRTFTDYAALRHWAGY